MLFKNFKPTAEMISAAELVFVAMAAEQTVHPIVEAYQRKVLAAHNWPIAAKWVDEPARRRREKYMNGEPILDPKDSFLLDEEASAIYFAEIDKEARAAGYNLPPDHCPLLTAEHQRIKAEQLLITAMSSLTKVNNDNIWKLGYDKRQEYLELCKKIMAPFVKGDKSLQRVLGRAA